MPTVKMLGPRLALLACSVGLQRDRQRHLRHQRDHRHHEEHRPGHVLRPDDDAEQQQPGDREVRGEDPGDVVERARARVRAQDDQRDRRHADQHQEQQHRPAAQRMVPDPVAQREQVVDLPRASLLSRRDRRVSRHHRDHLPWWPGFTPPWHAAPRPPSPRCAMSRAARIPAEDGGAQLGLRRLLERDQERDGRLGVRAEGEHAVAGEQDGLGTRSFLDQLDDGVSPRGPPGPPPPGPGGAAVRTGPAAAGPRGRTRADAGNACGSPRRPVAWLRFRHGAPGCCPGLPLSFSPAGGKLSWLTATRHPRRPAPRRSAPAGPGR